MEKTTHRVIFSRQPARIMLVDFSAPFDMDTCHTLQQSVGRFFCLACNLSGPPRAPFFGLFALGNYPEAILPLQPSRNNLPRLESALNELQILFNNSQTKIKKSRCLGQGLQEAVAQYKRQSNNLLQNAGYWCQLELIIVTSQNGTSVAKQAEKVIKTLQLDSLRKVQVLVLHQTDQLRFDDEEASDSQLSEGSTEELEGIVDILTVMNDSLSLENFFKTWLQDTGTDKEHLHLSMPRLAPDGENLLLKFDLHERLINPALLSCAAQFCLQIDGETTTRTNFGGNKATMTVPVYKMRAEQLVHADSICESTLFGQPLVMKPTSCWKMDWDELETNQHNVYALCHLLNVFWSFKDGKVFFTFIPKFQNMVLLGSLEAEQPNQGPLYSKSSCSKPSGHFILMPSQSCALVVRSIAVRELILPCELSTMNETPNSESLDIVSRSLEQLVENESYNPLLTDSGLYECLSRPQGNKQQKRKPVTQGGQKTKKNDVTPDPSNSQPSTNQKRFRPSLGKMVYGNKASFPTQL
ncbi:meiosis 1 arrest protein-like [Lineus longissimus]|uniref:meiosis 1 arrest protein-like n=1 Tax=Lineus longissimus TaxID=88925 RepID=UPI00315C5B8E